MHRDCVMLQSLLRVSLSNVKYPALPAKASEVWQRKETTQNFLVRRSCCGRTHSTTTFIRRRQLRRLMCWKRRGFPCGLPEGKFFLGGPLSNSGCLIEAKKLLCAPLPFLKTEISTVVP